VRCLQRRCVYPRFGRRSGLRWGNDLGLLRGRRVDGIKRLLTALSDLSKHPNAQRPLSLCRVFGTLRHGKAARLLQLEELSVQFKLELSKLSVQDFMAPDRLDIPLGHLCHARLDVLVAQAYLDRPIRFAYG